MTITSSRSSRRDENTTVPTGAQRHAPIDWVAVQPSLWVGKTNGEFAGMIEATTTGQFIATTRLAKPVGVFDTRKEAQESFSRLAQ